MTGVFIQKVPYGGWENCLEIANGTVDLVVTLDVGPRIIRYGLRQDQNEFCEIESELGLTGSDQWRMYGGHRLWHSPESRPRTYEPDNSPVTWAQIPDGIKTVQDREPSTGIQKEMEISLSPDTSRVHILHRLTNKGPWSIELSAWSITALAAGGKEIIPQTRRDTGLLPNRSVSLWPYTRMNDHRIHWGEKYLILKQDPEEKRALKLGIPNEEGWAAYWNHNHLFVKYHTHDRRAEYPDFGSSYETYTNDFMLEMETLSPLTQLEPDARVEHREMWELFGNVPEPPDEESAIDVTLAQRVRRGNAATIL